MRARAPRGSGRLGLAVVAVALGGALQGCADQGVDALAPQPASAVVGAELASAPPVEPGELALLGADPNDALSRAKAHFRRGEYAVAEQEYRKAVQLDGRDYEAWIGLAASYDKMRRFDLADRAYDAAIRIGGTTPTVLNNQGYSYMLRGDFRNARAKLERARAVDPENPYVRQNLEVLASARGRTVE
ncbi:tetratricopeptide repeat protein [Prosthecomicrobium sp. N25]|uniref:tetratricopeptide repeat protein n=1 Tax=Prosthecomicrobium sp. N25 TaxID=3129254 RepID=UPI00307793DC